MGLIMNAASRNTLVGKMVMGVGLTNKAGQVI